MPQIILIALVGAGLWLGWRILRKEMRRVDRELRKAEHDLRAGERPIALEKDPETGVYKPKD